ncbi:hypothetical protein NYQ10_04040 [Flavobacterium johnsoniae]|uniref:hypothetical protein n=1 Tax=Flavobacterium johnsoniae TaxID=986 RepID=UPI0025B1ED80|nr:hypothetical protein [Flavobacterium johnsoniae]WJS95627.1 hypothetical protein NYQ10_04040 [Flavobacterium johnsoniae]
MKQILLFLSLFCSTVLLSQTVLTSYPLDLKNKKQRLDFVNAENTITHDVFVFLATDSLSILKYNSALFLKQKIVTSRKFVEDRSLIGYSFSEDGNPILYWFSAADKSIILIKYYLENNTSRALKFRIPLEDKSLLNYYQKDNNFYLLMKDKTKEGLTAFIFKNGIAEEKYLDFSPFVFRDRKTQQKTFNQILRENPIEKMDSGEYNPLYKVTSKSKLYTLPNRLILTLDQSLRKTQLFDINLNNLEIKEKTFLQPVGQKNSKKSNSYYHENKLYQVNVNAEQLLLDIKDYESESSLKTFIVSKKDTIQFKNSPLLLQINDRKPRELKNTSKFLQELATTDVGISVFKNKQNLFLTLGGTGMQSKSITAVDMMPDFYSDFMPPSYYNIDTYYSVFFESVWSKKLETTNQNQEPLAGDKIYAFIDSNKGIFPSNTLKLSNYSILGYYDPNSKQYVLRKFTDGFN